MYRNYKTMTFTFLEFNVSVSQLLLKNLTDEQLSF